MRRRPRPQSSAAARTLDPRHPGATTAATAAAAIALACSPADAQAQTPANPEPAAALPAELRDLPDDQVESGMVRSHSLSLASPTELLFVMAKMGAPRWRKLYHPTPRHQDIDRGKTALRLGLSITEGYLATMARDVQRLRDVTNDIHYHARVLGISSRLGESTRAINRLAEHKAWPSVAYELEALTARTARLLRAQRDPDLGDLVSVGLWIRLLHVTSSIVNQEDFPDTTVAIGSHFTLEQLAWLTSPRNIALDSDLRAIHDQLAKLERMWHPHKLANGHAFDDALVRESHDRLAVAQWTFAKALNEPAKDRQTDGAETAPAQRPPPTPPTTSDRPAG